MRKLPMQVPPEDGPLISPREDNVRTLQQPSDSRTRISVVTGLILASASFVYLAISWCFSSRGPESSDIQSTIDLNTEANLKLVNSVYGGAAIDSADFWEEKWADDATFVIMKVPGDEHPITLTKKDFVPIHKAVVASFSDFHFKVVKKAEVQEDGSITSVLRATGKNTGASFAAMPGWKPVKATGKTVENDPEKVTTFFNEDGKIIKQIIEPMPGGSGLNGPVGFYIQIGGKPPPPPTKQDKTNERNLKLVNSVYGGEIITSAAFWEESWADDATLVFIQSYGDRTPKVLPKESIVPYYKQILDSFSDFRFSVVDKARVQEDGSITSVTWATAKNTGAPFAAMPGWEPVKATGRTVLNDPERFTTFFNEDGKITKQIIQSLPGGAGLDGPVGFYIQIGGKPPATLTTGNMGGN